jgi:LPXTG-site transpeptidase (sortase) family protein
VVNRQRTVAPLVGALLVIGVLASAVGVARAAGIPLPQLGWDWDWGGDDGPPAAPARVTIGAIDLRANVVAVGTADDGTIAPPAKDPVHTVGWYEHGPSPGEPGTAVLVGHVDTNDRAAVFQRLHELRAGERIEVRRNDRRIATFTVDSVESFPKTAFPADRVLVHGDTARLALITCGGEWLGSAYADNVIVFAHLI